LWDIPALNGLEPQNVTDEPNTARQIANFRETACGLSVWLGAALIGSSGGTFLWLLALGEIHSVTAWNDEFDFALITLPFTIAGSAFLILIFSGLGRWMVSLPQRYGLLVLIGAVTGSVLMFWFDMGAGMVYGTATAISWVVLHLAVYQGR
jgi:hypothetical protein